VKVDYIALAIPAFVLLIALELGVAWYQGRRLYRLSDTINNLSCGIIQQVVGLLCIGFLVAGYLFISDRFALFELDADATLTWFACYMAIDFAYYWFHRLSHEVNFMWAAHVVHHQSEEYNLGVALRQSSLQQFMSMVFYWPLALIGFPPIVFFACASFNTLYQFWIHTRTIDRLGPLEHILMTPSHHRVHHGRNPIYIDRNHGATFIWWDKLFGTFEEESEPVAYGITTPLASWNPVWANLEYWAELWHTARATRAWSDKLRTFVKPPGWYPQDRGGPQPAPPIVGEPIKFDTTYSNRIGLWVTLQLVQLLALSGALRMASGDDAQRIVLLTSGMIVWGLTNLGGLFEAREWACRSEWIRLLALPVLVSLFLAPSALPWLVAAGLANAALAWWLGLRWHGLLDAQGQTPTPSSA
jgi:alkylglycerol monooxygenase